jgi:heme-degrading monooxygenase HmoA
MANSPCIVMVTVKTKPEYQKEIMEMSTKNVDKMKQLPGFIAHTLLKSEDGTLVVSRIEWESKTHHEDCENHQLWEEERKQWVKYFESGKAHIEVHVMEVVQRVEAQKATK